MDFSYMGVPENNGTPKSSILTGFSIINHPFWGYHYFWKHPYIYIYFEIYIYIYIYVHILHKTNILPRNVIFPFPKVGYLSSLEGFCCHMA